MIRLPEEVALLNIINAELAKLNVTLFDYEEDTYLSKARVIPAKILAKFGPSDYDPVVRRSAIGSLIASVVHLPFSSRGLSTDILPERAAVIREHVEALPYINELF